MSLRPFLVPKANKEAEPAAKAKWWADVSINNSNLITSKRSFREMAWSKTKKNGRARLSCPRTITLWARRSRVQTTPIRFHRIGSSSLWMIGRTTLGRHNSDTACIEATLTKRSSSREPSIGVWRCRILSRSCYRSTTTCKRHVPFRRTRTTPIPSTSMISWASIYRRRISHSITRWIRSKCITRKC